MTALSATEIRAVIKTLEVARDIVVSNNSTGAVLALDIHDTLQLMQQKEAKALATRESQQIVKNNESFNAGFVYDEIQKWRDKKEVALSSHDDTTIAIAMCYINAYQRVLDAHKGGQASEVTA